jgi:TonB-dependent starch-binding outer membrane protein SusC
VRRFAVSLVAVLLTVLVSGSASAQRRVTGRVTDSTGTPLASVTVTVLGTTLGGATDADGRYAIANVPNNAQTLVARRIGYRRTTQALAAGASTADIKMAADLLQLDEVVVTGQATSVSTQNSANAVTIVSAAEVNRVPQPNIENALQGKVPGAVITQNGGAPGGGVQVQIRGSNTVNGAFLPLYVVDGVIINNDANPIGLNSVTGAGGGITSSQDQQVNRVADLNPEDIEDIQVLKGPSAGAIYGSRGANGVIVITTKHGQAGKPSFNITQRLGTQMLAHHYDMRCFSFDQAVTVASGFGVTLTPQDYAGCVDPQETLYGNHFLSYETNMALRGGTGDANTTYFMSGTLKHDGGLQINSGYSKQSLRLNLNQLLGSKINLRGTSEILHTLTERGISGNDNNNIAPYTIFGATPTFFDFSRIDPTTGKLVKDPYVAGGANPLQDAQEIRTPEEVYRLIGNLSGDYQVFTSARQSLLFTALGGVDAYNDHSRVYSPPDTYIEQSGNIGPFPGTIVEGNADVVNANLNASLIHKLTFNLGTATSFVEHSGRRPGTRLVPGHHQLRHGRADRRVGRPGDHPYLLVLRPGRAAHDERAAAPHRRGERRALEHERRHGKVLCLPQVLGIVQHADPSARLGLPQVPRRRRQGGQPRPGQLQVHVPEPGVGERHRRIASVVHGWSGQRAA